MEFNFLWLLSLPVFFGLGWLAARIDLRQLLRESRRVPQAYFKGLNFLLSEQHDKALESLVSVAHNHPDTVELQFALGSLFRRKGEIDKAITLHQSIVARQDVTEEIRSDALEALGHDFLKAGLFDRAEDAFTRLLSTNRSTAAKEALLGIYQQEREWPKAIDMARQLSDTPHAWQAEVAQFHCELAHRAMSELDWPTATLNLEAALNVHRKCVRATIMLGDLALAQKLPEEAIKIWRRVESQDAEFLPMVAERLLRTYEQQSRLDEGLALLKGLYLSHPSLDLLEHIIHGELQQGRLNDAYVLLKDELRRQPTLAGLDQLLQVQLQVVPVERRADLEQVRQLVHQHADRLNMYSCKHCGFKARQYFWHCPGCATWESYSPQRYRALA
ncbi:lipopolysaccharide assembly protein LapB [Leeia oryzae]|uniref:lipopolysaccharide assembly protein LapB n=1 Tax=Leeia oryzae TaxID=356662 RepID=UPI000376D919|nr:lipopolysaccharide assembly protein LapB [Leeia oryzae]